MGYLYCSSVLNDLTRLKWQFSSHKFIFPYITLSCVLHKLKPEGNVDASHAEESYIDLEQCDIELMTVWDVPLR